MIVGVLFLILAARTQICRVQNGKTGVRSFGSVVLCDDTVHMLVIFVMIPSKENGHR